MNWIFWSMGDVCLHGIGHLLGCPRLSSNCYPCLRTGPWLVCQHSIRGFVSSEKHETTSEAGVEGRSNNTSGVTIAAKVLGGYCLLLEPPEVVSRAAKVAKRLKSRTPAKLYIYETLLQRLAQDLQDMAAALGPFIQEEHAVVG
jgi:hypothetical protein